MITPRGRLVKFFMRFSWTGNDRVCHAGFKRLRRFVWCGLRWGVAALPRKKTVGNMLGGAREGSGICYSIYILHAGRNAMTLLFSKKRKRTLKELSGAKAYLKHLHCALDLPSKAVICPLSSLTKYALSQGHFEKYNCEADIYVERQKGFCYVTGFGVGAPAMAMALEVLIALGVKEMVLVGLAGSLQPEVLASDIVLCDGAAADEGTSAHYVPEEFLRPSAALTKQMGGILSKQKQDYHLGPTWTTDAMFRETAEEVAYYQKKNILTVEMEASAFFAICAQKKVKGAAAFVISDELYRLKWEPHFGEKAISQHLYTVYHAAVKTLADK